MQPTHRRADVSPKTSGDVFKCEAENIAVIGLNPFQNVHDCSLSSNDFFSAIEV